ncbi:MAG: hypothetical protein LRY73_09220 [Bacillus sp. (in: Bacteria)]|nr:hypothetical protein [Bacillus sp. (in: firmicutes)]
MRIPPLYKEKSWQRLFAGFILGLIFGWVFFLYHFGHVYEKVLMDNRELEATVGKQEKRIEQLEEENREKAKNLQEEITVRELEIYFINEKDVAISELTLHNLRTEIEGALDSVLGKKVETIIDSSDILTKTIENLTITISGKGYSVEVEELFILNSNIRIGLNIKAAD